ncbi:DUF4129 domain-containing protein [Leifsonia sp. NPDC058292]|uniref:DUF4129 domain-containing protein n=1 Tax=Leifsonia sp. NPDC058292 TaxID=3346428 RepID=UPI0036DC50A7
MKRHRTVLVCSGLLLIAVVAIAVQGAPRFGRMVWVPQWTQPTAPAVVDTNGASATPAPLSRPHTTVLDLSWVFLLAAVVVITVVALLIWRAVRKRLAQADREIVVAEVDGLGETVPLPEEPDAPQVRRGLDRAIDILDEERVPRDAIEQAWLGLQEAAEESGVRRLAAETPSEFTARILVRVGADSGAAKTLLDLYLRARFGDAPVTAGQVDTARRSLESLRASWTTSDRRGGA